MNFRHQKVDALNINLLKIFLLEQTLPVRSKCSSYIDAQRSKSYRYRRLVALHLLILGLIEYFHLFSRLEKFNLELRKSENELHLGQLSWILNGRLDGMQPLLRVFDRLTENH